MMKGVSSMKQGPTRLFIALLALVMAAGLCWRRRRQAQNPQQKKAVEQQKQEEQELYTEESMTPTIRR